MIRITIEMVPLGFESAKYPLHIIEIVNDATGTPTHGNYVVRFSKKLSETTGGWWKTTEVKNFPRKRLNTYHILRAALNQVIDKDF